MIDGPLSLADQVKIHEISATAANSDQDKVYRNIWIPKMLTTTFLESEEQQW
jgi:hypothetical protein